MMLARGEKSKFRFYNISSAINSDKKHYYEILERAQKGNGDLTEWIQWYITTLIRALDTSAGMLNSGSEQSRLLESCSHLVHDGKAETHHQPIP
jgi:Fic family protein